MRYHYGSPRHHLGVSQIRKFVIGIATVTLALSTPAYADATSDLNSLVDDYWFGVLGEPVIIQGTLVVGNNYSGVGNSTLAAQDHQAAVAAAYLEIVQTIPQIELEPAAKVEYAILSRTLTETVEGNRFGQRAINFTGRSGWHLTFAEMAAEGRFATANDFEMHNVNMQQYGTINDQSIAMANVAIKGRHTLACDVLDGYERGIAALIVTDERRSPFFVPYTRPRPSAVSEEDFKTKADAASTIIKTVINPALKKHLDWYLKRYKPACSKQPGVSAQPGGAAYYKFRIRQQTTTNLTAEQIHQIGLTEVKRISADIDVLAAKAGYPNRSAFITELRSNPKYYATTSEALLENAARAAKTIDGKMPTLFHKLPRLPYGIKAMTAESAQNGTLGSYARGSSDYSQSGTVSLNTSKPQQRPLWEVPATMLHEGVPGHHQQAAIQQELPLSEFRKNGVDYSAFSEGWGLYSESLGTEMGLYDTPEKEMGRLSLEIWRASRLVVDTGLHAKGWSKAKAAAYMKDNTFLSDAMIEAEVNRYISWPGQALAYKIGELKIHELRGLASKELGTKFDLAEFHDVVLGQGAVPLDILEAQVKEWIAAKQIQ
jgi:uncharacterized protein (DUF885 family)